VLFKPLPTEQKHFSSQSQKKKDKGLLLHNAPALNATIFFFVYFWCRPLGILTYCGFWGLDFTSIFTGPGVTDGKGIQVYYVP